MHLVFQFMRLLSLESRRFPTSSKNFVNSLLQSVYIVDGQSTVHASTGD